MTDHMAHATSQPAPLVPGTQPRKLIKRVGITLAGILVGFGCYLGLLQLTGNFHEVIVGRFYRSAQLSPKQLAQAIDRYHIKTVINLRGSNPGSKWYDQEMDAVRERNVTHIDFSMSANRKLTQAESLELVSLMRNAEGPILIHCRAGADRTGLAAVMYLQQIAGVPEDQAEWQLSPLYGHLSIPFTGAYAMDDTWETFEHLIGLSS